MDGSEDFSPAVSPATEGNGFGMLRPIDLGGVRIDCPVLLAPMLDTESISDKKVLVVDDSGFFRRRVSEILSADPDIQVVGTATNGREAIDQALALKPDDVSALSAQGDAMVQRGAFDQLGASHAICNVVYGAQAVFDSYMAADFCKAINDWIAAEWLARDSRLRASIVVPIQAPDLAVEEIERRAGDNRFVSVLVPSQGEMLLGRRHYWPIYQAAEKYRLPIAIHAGSAYRGAPSSIGWPSLVTQALSRSSEYCACRRARNRTRSA